MFPLHIYITTIDTKENKKIERNYINNLKNDKLMIENKYETELETKINIEKILSFYNESCPVCFENFNFQNNIPLSHNEYEIIINNYINPCNHWVHRICQDRAGNRCVICRYEIQKRVQNNITNDTIDINITNNINDTFYCICCQIRKKVLLTFIIIFIPLIFISLSYIFFNLTV